MTHGRNDRRLDELGSRWSQLKSAVHEDLRVRQFLIRDEELKG